MMARRLTRRPRFCYHSEFAVLLCGVHFASAVYVSILPLLVGGAQRVSNYIMTERFDFTQNFVIITKWARQRVVAGLACALADEEDRLQLGLLSFHLCA